MRAPPPTKAPPSPQRPNPHDHARDGATRPAAPPTPRKPAAGRRHFHDHRDLLTTHLRTVSCRTCPDLRVRKRQRSPHSPSVTAADCVRVGSRRSAGATFMIKTTYPRKRTAGRPVCPDFGVRKRGYAGSAVRMDSLSLVTQRNRREGLRGNEDKWAAAAAAWAGKRMSGAAGEVRRPLAARAGADRCPWDGRPANRRPPIPERPACGPAAPAPSTLRHKVLGENP